MHFAVRRKMAHAGLRGGKNLVVFGAKSSDKLDNGAPFGLAFAGAEKVAVALGDNIFSDDLSSAIKGFDHMVWPAMTASTRHTMGEREEGARLFLKKVHDPQRFGVAEVARDNVQIESRHLHG